MKCEFEEKEYEGPLNAQLARDTGAIWTPGQVFEGHFGIDAAYRIVNPILWAHVGFRQAMQGAFLTDLPFKYLNHKSRDGFQFPSFKLNLFLQIKRPDWMMKRFKPLNYLNLERPYWRFKIKRHQQNLLEKLSEEVGKQAYVAYACAAFHRRAELYRYTENGTIAEESTFIEVAKLKGHHQWVYDRPGSFGIALSEPEEINDASLYRRIVISATNELSVDSLPSSSLRKLSDAITRCTSEELSVENPVANEIRRRYKNTRSLIEDTNLRMFLNVANFAFLTNSTWIVLK